jgi:hypothetical protein
VTEDLPDRPTLTVMAGRSRAIHAPSLSVMAGRVPAIRASSVHAKMAGTRPAMTDEPPDTHEAYQNDLTPLGATHAAQTQKTTQ